ncbi:RNase H domain-containing protein [Trichonephila clavipes]|nr:RNase H domain-containing protein [Trichonephila clavipes]
MDSTGQDILFKLARLGLRKQVCLQWIPSHVGVPGNEVIDELVGRSCDLSNPSSTVLSHSEIHFFQRIKMNLTWQNPPAHHWYAAKSPSLSLQCRSSRAHQTALERLRSGHLLSTTSILHTRGLRLKECRPVVIKTYPGKFPQCHSDRSIDRLSIWRTRKSDGVDIRTDLLSKRTNGAGTKTRNAVCGSANQRLLE